MIIEPNSLYDTLLCGHITFFKYLLYPNHKLKPRYVINAESSFRSSFFRQKHDLQIMHVSAFLIFIVMSKENSYRDDGARGAILDEYEKALHELLYVIEDINPTQLLNIVDPSTEDQDCRSIQTILTHVIYAGYGYCTLVQDKLGYKTTRPDKLLLNTVEEYTRELKKMFQYNLNFFNMNPTLSMEAFESDPMETSWGIRYNLDQLYEHAIVHILRHRRQIERFKLKLGITVSSKI